MGARHWGPLEPMPRWGYPLSGGEAYNTHGSSCLSSATAASIAAVIFRIKAILAAGLRSRVAPISSANIISAASIASAARSSAVFTTQCSGPLARRERARLSLLLITPTPPRPCYAPIWVGIVRACAPAAVLTTSIRNAITPLPIAPLVAPVGPVPTASTAVAHRLERRCRTWLDRGRLWRERCRLCRRHQR